MIPAPLFCLLNICHTKEYATNKQMTRIIKDGVLKYLKYGSRRLNEELNIKEYFVGWEQLMMAKCNHNELMDVKTINMPNLK